MSEELNITKKTVEKLTIEVPSLDPIGVFVENFKLGQAKVTIEIFGEAWSYYWGAMGDRTLEEFFTNVPYLAQKFCKGNGQEIDYEAISNKVGFDIDITTAMVHSEDMKVAYGDDWYMDLPTKNTDEFEYLTRIVSVIVLAFKTKTPLDGNDQAA